MNIHVADVLMIVFDDLTPSIAMTFKLNCANNWLTLMLQSFKISFYAYITQVLFIG